MRFYFLVIVSVFSHYVNIVEYSLLFLLKSFFFYYFLIKRIRKYYWIDLFSEYLMLALHLANLPPTWANAKSRWMLGLHSFTLRQPGALGIRFFYVD